MMSWSCTEPNATLLVGNLISSRKFSGSKIICTLEAKKNPWLAGTGAICSKLKFPPTSNVAIGEIPVMTITWWSSNGNPLQYTWKCFDDDPQNSLEFLTTAVHPSHLSSHIIFDRQVGSPRTELWRSQSTGMPGLSVYFTDFAHFLLTNGSRGDPLRGLECESSLRFASIKSELVEAIANFTSQCDLLNSMSSNRKCHQFYCLLRNPGPV